MNTPNLDRIVDTYVLVRQPNYCHKFLSQLRTDILQHIRRMESDGCLRWYAFLLHDADQLGGRAPHDGRAYIHLRLEPETHVEVEDFIERLPSHFQKPIRVTLGEINPLRSAFLENEDWSNAWRLHGEASAFVLALIETHKDTDVPVEQVFSFLHYITNPLYLGNQSAFLPGGFLPF